METPGGEKYIGNYVAGKKEGTWIKINFKNGKSQIEYSNNKIVHLTNPYSYEIIDFLKEFRDLELSAQFDNTIELATRIVIEPNQSSSEGSNSFIIKLGNDNQISVSKSTNEGKAINGYYHYFTSTFNFELEKALIKFKIIEIGKSKIVLERKK